MSRRGDPFTPRPVNGRITLPMHASDVRIRRPETMEERIEDAVLGWYAASLLEQRLRRLEQATRGRRRTPGGSPQTRASATGSASPGDPTLWQRGPIPGAVSAPSRSIDERRGIYAGWADQADRERARVVGRALRR